MTPEQEEALDNVCRQMDATGSPSAATVVWRPATRQELASKWTVALLLVAAVSALLAGIGAANLFATEVYYGTQLNAAAGFGAAIGVMLAWLPWIALFHLLSRD
jgi:hypothetical protein